MDFDEKNISKITVTQAFAMNEQELRAAFLMLQVSYKQLAASHFMATSFREDETRNKTLPTH